MDYWKEHAEIAMDEAGLTATEDQLDTIAGVIESAHEFYGQSMGHDVASANWHAEQRSELAKAQLELGKEKQKVLCRECRGEGVITTSYYNRSLTSQCWKCNGNGRHTL